MTPQYTAVSGRVMLEGRPMDMERALTVRDIHRRNGAYWLTRDDLKPAGREMIAKIDYALADELEAAIRAAELQATGEMA